MKGFNKLLCTILFLVVFVSLHGQSTFWNGNINSDWNNVSNWSNGVPTFSKEAGIGTTANNPVIGSGTYANAKDISINGSAILTIDNNATLVLDGAPTWGAYISSDAILQVNANATLQIYNTSNDAILANGQIINYGSIEIGASGPIGGQGIGVYNKIENKSSGNIFINDVQNDNALFVSINGNLINEGGIYLGNLAPILRGVYNSGTISNQSNGIIQVENNIAIYGIRSYIGATISNHGEISIGQNSTIVGNGIENYGLFTNSISGIIKIDNVVDDGFNIQPDGTVNNFGDISIGKNSWNGDDGLINYGICSNHQTGIITVRGIKNLGMFENKSCANIFLYDELSNPNSNSIVNDGFISLFSNVTHTPGLFTNNGIIGGLVSTFPTNGTGYTENGVILNSLSIVDCNTSISSIFSNLNNYSVVGIYQDVDATISAGVYNTMSDIFTNYLSNGTYTLYVKLQSSNGSCSGVVSWQVNVSFSDTITFTGSGNAVDWHDPQNWDLGIVPDRCHNVIIPSPYQVVINSFNIGLGKTLIVYQNAELTTNLNAQLDIVMY